MLKQGHSEKLRIYNYRPRNGDIGNYSELIQLLTVDDVGRYEHRFPRIGFHFRVTFFRVIAGLNMKRHTRERNVSFSRNTEAHGINWRNC
jgi:hypothetical protein